MSDSDSDIDEINRYFHDTAALSNIFCKEKALQIRKPKNIQ